MTAFIQLVEATATAVSTPAASRVNLFADVSSGGLAFVDSSGTVHGLGANATITSVNGVSYPGTVGIGDIFSVSATNTVAVVTGNVSTTRKFLTQTGTGTGSALPTWGTLSATDLPAPTLTSLAAATNLVWTVTGLADDVAQTSLTIAATLSITGAVAGFCGTLIVKQGGGGSLTLPSGSVVRDSGAGAIALSTTTGAVDTLAFICNATASYLWTYAKSFT